MIIVGLTGGIGSGKSYVSNEFAKLGIPVYSSDDRAKELMVSNSEIKGGLLELFGKNAFENNVLNRKWIAEKVFTDKTLLDAINRLVHPIVANDFENWCQKHFLQKIVIKEAAILIESGAYKNCHCVILVTAPKDLRIERVMQRDKLSYAEVVNRIENQLGDNEKLKFARFVINNDGIANVKNEVKKIIKELAEL
jgi:dephospho-CoA kinase